MEGLREERHWRGADLPAEGHPPQAHTRESTAHTATHAPHCTALHRTRRPTSRAALELSLPHDRTLRWGSLSLVS